MHHSLQPLSLFGCSQKGPIKRACLIQLFGLLLILMAPSVFAQERVKSLNIRQFEIEESIRNGLKYYLEPSDYVLRVKLFGEERASSVANEALPGFGQVGFKQSGKGEKYWEILRMRVDLVMHKEVSPSVNSYIGEIVPILSGLDYERGDEFVFVPIIPNLPEARSDSEKAKDAVPENLEESQPGEKALAKIETPGDTHEELPFWKTLGPFEWILAAVLLLLLILLIWTLFSISRLRAREAETQDQIRDLKDSPTLPVRQAREEKAVLDKMQQDRQDRVQTALVRDENERVLQEIVKNLVGRPDWCRELIQEMTRDKQSMDQLATLIAVLGPEASRSLFRPQMTEQAYMDLEQLAKEAGANSEDTAEVLKNIRMFLLTKQFLSPEQSFVDPFGFMKTLSPSQISFLLKNEPSRIKAIVMARLDTEKAATILQSLSRDERTQVAVELGKMHEMPMELVEKVGFNLAEKARNVPDENSIAVNGVRFVADVLSDSDPVTRQELINGLRVSDQQLSADVESSCFIFESIPVVPNDVLKEVVRQLPPDDVIIAISGATKEIKEAVILCFPEQSRKALISSLKSKSPEKEEIRIARRKFVDSMREMADAERVNLRDVNSAYANQAGVPALQ
ncbi:MAG: FliG C-terminal domain-containing protein [SAR324 cluster bacterium]|nr:FliG C-terminal domain-containing protein [SAR324 cluster bacterium]MEE1576742.1 FliG C-terminal domain-containing protein [Deltaproteobacteria bacterium]MDP6249132.1 FliG C-terminal domain-containing protein [SAR324 cluster bacterium]MDP6463394.1 FliG C-terminal domain-containing protein [SAR324 cluster bacterium]MDP6638459.1 FliG C-terminal domain-containing protein [SAR324 cluster bacterium]